MPEQDRETLTSQGENARLRYPDTQDFPQGPAVGESLPDFALLDQHGDSVRYSESRGNDCALVMFHRSARW
jgi:hypothetical protein